MAVIPKAILALDVGSKRIGVAVASLEARLPRPLVTLPWNDDFFPALARLITQEAAAELVIGLPRGLEGQHTAQTTAIENFVTELRTRVALPIHLQDEALTSRQAEAELEARGKPYKRADVDALAATYILTDFLAGHQEVAA